MDEIDAGEEVTLQTSSQNKKKKYIELACTYRMRKSIPILAKGETRRGIGAK